MEQIVNLHIERLPEGVFFAVSDDVPGLVAQGRTLQETLEIARDVAKNCLRRVTNARECPPTHEPQADVGRHSCRLVGLKPGLRTALKFMDSIRAKNWRLRSLPLKEAFDYPIVVGA